MPDTKINLVKIILKMFLSEVLEINFLFKLKTKSFKLLLLRGYTPLNFKKNNLKYLTGVIFGFIINISWLS